MPVLEKFIPPRTLPNELIAVDKTARLFYNLTMTYNKSVDRALKIFCAAFAAVSLALTFTVSDYYIFDKFDTYNPVFIICQWLKKSGLLLFPLAVFFNKKKCADAAKYILPVVTVISLFTFGGFFDITMMTATASPADKVYASINEFIPKSVHGILFFVEAELIFAICILFFVRDGFKISGKSLLYFLLAVLAVTPLNIFENFYDERLFDNRYPELYKEGSFLLFKSFSVWHLLAAAILAGFTVGTYFFLKSKDKKLQGDWLAAFAIALLIQYHSKDSVVMGDGYNVYTTVFACIPLFICNIGVYIACLSVFLKKRVLYSIAFFVHAAGALSVFVYFGDKISNYGIFCGYSILYFCCTHCLLFMLSVLPSALGHYKFRPKDAVIPLIYYCGVIVVAAISSALVTSASMGFSFGGYTLQEGEWLYPNYAFTQNNPLPIPEPELFVTIWRCRMNIAYLIILYLVYVGLFYIFNGAYYLFIAVRKRLAARRAIPAAPQNAYPSAGAEAAYTEVDGDLKNDDKKL